MGLEKLTWQAVVVVGMVLSAVVWLSIIEADVMVIAAMLLALGIGGVGGAVAGVRNNINGHLTELMQTLREAVDKLASSTPRTETPLPFDEPPP